MMRLLLLCLLLPTATAYSEDINGSGDESDEENDDEIFPTLNTKFGGSPGKATGEDSDSDQITLTIIVVAVVVLVLSVAAVIAYILVRRRMNKQQQGIYSVPIDQDKKEAV